MTPHKLRCLREGLAAFGSYPVRVEADTLFPEPCIAVTLPPGVHLTPEERTYLERLG